MMTLSTKLRLIVSKSTDFSNEIDAFQKECGKNDLEVPPLQLQTRGIYLTIAYGKPVVLAPSNAHFKPSGWRYGGVEYANVPEVVEAIKNQRQKVLAYIATLDSLLPVDKEIKVKLSEHLETHSNNIDSVLKLLDHTKHTFYLISSSDWKTDRPNSKFLHVMDTISKNSSKFRVFNHRDQALIVPSDLSIEDLESASSRIHIGSLIRKISSFIRKMSSIVTEDPNKEISLVLDGVQHARGDTEIYLKNLSEDQLNKIQWTKVPLGGFMFPNSGVDSRVHLDENGKITGNFEKIRQNPNSYVKFKNSKSNTYVFAKNVSLQTLQKLVAANIL